MANSKKRCKHCREYVSEWVRVPAGTFCTMEHAIAWAADQRQKAAKKDARKQKAADLERLATRGELMAKAQSAFNAFIRARDANLPCISCGRYHDGQWHAGHYMSTGAHPELRFNEDNVHKQCQPCNTHLSGNLINYRRNLIEKIGIAKVEELEGPHDPLKLSRDEIIALASEYRAKTRALLRNPSNTTDTLKHTDRTQAKQPTE